MIREAYGDGNGQSLSDHLREGHECWNHCNGATLIAERSVKLHTSIFSH